jgi:hypothetical protein
VASLEQVQQDFQSYLLTGEGEITRHVRGTERVPAATRLAIYRDGYSARLIEALGTGYPALARLLGESDFEELGSAYVKAHDSRFFSIRHYGHALAELLATDARYAAAPALSELARWEWVMGEVFDAADGAPIEASALAQVPPEQWARLRFTWHPAIRRLQLLWNVPQLWSAATGGTEPPAVSLQSEPVQWLLWRRELRTYFRSLPTAEAAALDAARAGSPFGELCVLLCQHVEEAQAPAQAASFLRRWLADGLLVAAALS